MDTQRAAGDSVAAFLQGPLGGSPADVPAAAAHHPNIHGGPAP
ncbi:hypothetical protein [Nocardia sp. NBC_01388]